MRSKIVQWRSMRPSLSRSKERTSNSYIMPNKTSSRKWIESICLMILISIVNWRVKSLRERWWIPRNLQVLVISDSSDFLMLISLTWPFILVVLLPLWLWLEPQFKVCWSSMKEMSSTQLSYSKKVRMPVNFQLAYQPVLSPQRLSSLRSTRLKAFSLSATTISVKTTSKLISSRSTTSNAEMKPYLKVISFSQLIHTETTICSIGFSPSRRLMAKTLPKISSTTWWQNPSTRRLNPEVLVHWLLPPSTPASTGLVPHPS